MMTFSTRLNMLRACAWVCLAALTSFSACSKEEKPATEAPKSTPAATPAAAAPAATNLPANATPEQRIIAQARAAIGPEAKLDAMTGVLLTGKIFDDKNNELGIL